MARSREAVVGVSGLDQGKPAKPAHRVEQAHELLEVHAMIGSWRRRDTGFPKPVRGSPLPQSPLLILTRSVSPAGWMVEQPQNASPGVAPRLATRRVIDAPHWGQVGDAGEAGGGWGAPGSRLPAHCTLAIIFDSASPSMSITPLSLANC
jgi:hypothetical protein